MLNSEPDPSPKGSQRHNKQSLLFAEEPLKRRGMVCVIVR